jgi:hypothetical protein
MKYIFLAIAALLPFTAMTSAQAQQEFSGAPQVLAAVQKRFPKATAIEQIGDESVTFEWRGLLWICALRNTSMRPMHCRTRHQ